MQIQDYIGILSKIISDKKNRTQMITKFQNLIRNGNVYKITDHYWELLSELAHDLDFYSEHITERRECLPYYGSEELEAEVKKAIELLKEGTFLLY